MFNKITANLNFQTDALVLRAERQRLISSNIANVDTPGYVARVGTKHCKACPCAWKCTWASSMPACSWPRATR